jgi:hypothetical protein
VSTAPQGFILSEAAQYSFKCQDVYPDIVAFAAAIPQHLRPLFLIPVAFETATASDNDMASRIADEIQPSGNTEEGDLFSTRTFVNDDVEGTIPNTEPGSMFDVDSADSLTHHQEYNFDENIQVPTDTSYMSDIDMTQYWDYPYRTKEKPVRKSSDNGTRRAAVIVRLALKPEYLQTRAPKKIKDNAKLCSVGLTSYDKETRVFTFSVDAGNGAHVVQAGLSDIDHVALSCDCNFWRWNGPEFHAKNNDFMLGQPAGTAGPPNVRDPKRQYWLCKHAYAVLRRLDAFVVEIVNENWEETDDELLRRVDDEWDRMEGAANVPLDELEDEDVDVDWESDTDEELLERIEPGWDSDEDEDEEERVEPDIEPEEELDFEADLKPSKADKAELEEEDEEPEEEDEESDK